MPLTPTFQKRKENVKCSEGHEASCMFAHGDPQDCKCACEGNNHGIALENNIKTYPELVDFLDAKEIDLDKGGAGQG